MKPNNLSKNRERERSREKKKICIYMCKRLHVCYIVYACANIEQLQADRYRQTDRQQSDRQIEIR